MFALELSLFQMCAGLDTSSWVNTALEEYSSIDEIQEFIGDTCRETDPNLFKMIVQSTSVKEKCPMDYFVTITANISKYI